MKKIGILGGGQLGKMLCLAGANWDLEIYVLEDDANCPAAPYCTKLVIGDIKNKQDVVNFGQLVDVITIEIEHVNTEGLIELQNQGKTVHPNPHSLNKIKDKGIQKAFFEANNIPTSKVFYCENKAALSEIIFYPSVWKSRMGGYDGKGVSILKTTSDFQKLPNEPCILEEMVEIDEEIAIIVARNATGEVVAYPAVEMVFNAKTNMLDYQICPANLSVELEQEAKALARKVIESFDICGLLAVEMFITKSSDLLINEVAPRPHNSGHHTIEATETSQFEQHLRGILNLPLGSTKMRLPSVLLNLVGEEDFEGSTKVEGWEKVLNTEGVHIHLYGKKTTKPNRKMGHATILNKNITDALENAAFIKQHFKITSHAK